MSDPKHYKVTAGTKRTVDLLGTYFRIQVTVGGRPGGTIKFRLRPHLHPSLMEGVDTGDISNRYPDNQFEQTPAEVTLTLTADGVATFSQEYRLLSALMIDDTGNELEGDFWVSVYQFNDNW